MKRCVESPLIYLFAYLCLPLIYAVVGLLVNTIYGVLTTNLPEYFKNYSVITHPHEYATCQAILSAITIFICLYFVQKIYYFLDNGRFEYMIAKTEGMYTMVEGLGLYYRSFWLDDILTCVLTSVILYIPVIYIPEKFMEMGVQFIFFPADVIYSHFGTVNGAILLPLMAVLSRAVESICAVKSYRANWLSGSIE